MADTNLPNTDWTDAQLLTAIRGGGAGRETALRVFYLRPGLREAVYRHVLDHGGSRDDAADVLQECLILFDRNLREGRFEGKSALATYFIGIAKWHWLSQRRQKSRFTSLAPEQYDGYVESADQETLRAEQRDLIDAALGQIGERCRQLLRLYQLDYSMEEIAQNMAYGSADVAKKEAYRCRMRFRELLEQQPEWAKLLNLRDI